MFEKETKKIKNTSQVGLWGSAAVVILAALFLYASPWRFPMQSEYVNRWMLIVGSVLAVLSLSMALLVIRKQVPRLRQTEGLGAKLAGYAGYIQSLYLSILAVVVVLCLMTMISNQNVLLMLAMVTVLMLILAYPNIYKVKVDLGLTDEEMKSLYGDRYIVEQKDEK
ncbi:MAG: hypothetical protein IJ634_07880 [Bacteroidales bacterium]|nr:hypothetical protein [Bacteroidales bacterium]